MSVRCSAIIEAMEKFAPSYLAESWDNVGLVVGSPEQEIDKVLVALDVTEKVIDQAVSIGANLIISHHPLIFKGITNLRTDVALGKMLARLIKAEIAVYAAHTNLDSTAGGVNDVLAQKLGLQNVKPLSTVYRERLHKLVVFVPADHAEQVRTAMAEAGAGHIGNYSHCSFQTTGVGSFLPLAGTKPFIGQQGEIEQVEEYKIETIMPATIREQVVDAMLKAHPYEEVAYDEYLLVNTGAALGLGRVGSLAKPVSVSEFITEVKNALKVPHVKIAGADSTTIKRVAVCGGSGAGLIKEAIKNSADALVTGDIKYHEAQEAVAGGLMVVDAGHFSTEQPVVECVAKYLEQWAVEESLALEVTYDMSSRDIFTVY